MVGTLGTGTTRGKGEEEVPKRINNERSLRKESIQRVGGGLVGDRGRIKKRHREDWWTVEYVTRIIEIIDRGDFTFEVHPFSETK